MKEFQSLLNSEFVVLTGTMVYGPVSATSDIDIVMLAKTAEAFIKSLPPAVDVHIHENDDYGEQMGSIEIKLSQHFPIINIIRVKDTTEMFKWKYATGRMQQLAMAITDRDKRVNKFHEFQNEALPWLEKMRAGQK